MRRSARPCARSRGVVLRREIYAEDCTAKAGIPYMISERSYAIVPFQCRSERHHGVFFVHAREAITSQLERNPADPRVLHEFVLEVDEFGNVRRAAAVAYGRRPGADWLALAARDRQVQAELLCTLFENDYTNAIDVAHAHRTPMLSEARTYELTGLHAQERLCFGEVQRVTRAALPVPFEDGPRAGSRQQLAAEGGPSKRIVEQRRFVYRRDDLVGPLPLGRVESMALLHETRQLAFHAGAARAELWRPYPRGDAHGRRLRARPRGSGWWVPSGRGVLFSR
ncbi:MAG: hypothetical protein HC927_00465 [Deltaproteobacteria bacterium]|nr:hypothetical protein [Deltaproteobacteria bacterium]